MRSTFCSSQKAAYQLEQDRARFQLLQVVSCPLPCCVQNRVEVLHTKLDDLATRGMLHQLVLLVSFQSRILVKARSRNKELKIAETFVLATELIKLFCCLRFFVELGFPLVFCATGLCREIRTELDLFAYYSWNPSSFE